MKGAALGAGAAAIDLGFLSRIAEGDTNPIVTENLLAGSTDWDLPFLDVLIEGFPTEYSVNAGETVSFKINTASSNYRIDIYRIGWYGGSGGRLVATVAPSVPLPQVQPAPIVDGDLGLTDCGNWAVSASWAVPASAVSGVYLAIFVRLDVVGEPSNRALFVVRNDGRTSDLLVQTSDATYQAYNEWGGNSLYTGDNTLYGRSVKVSYNRPMKPGQLENEFFYAEMPLVRWLERNGYDVAYTSCIDTDRRPAELLLHKVFVSSGHDEYWSGTMRTNVEAARDAGVNLVFMSGNELFWKVRWEDSTDVSASPYKTLVCYKETFENAKVDPSLEWTGTWRDPRFSPPSDGGRPENALTGTLFKAINPTEDIDFTIEVPYEYSRLRIWRNTDIASLTSGTKATLADSTLGYEWDTDPLIPSRPNGLIRLSETTALANQVLVDYGKTYVPGLLTHYLTLYRAASGALVWGTGTVQWSWGLDAVHTYNNPPGPVPADLRIQQATLNMLADMGVQPESRQVDLQPATASSDTLPPESTITSPLPGATITIGTPLTITGTAVDHGGGTVAAVEVSVDGGATWQLATGRDSWSHPFTPRTQGTINVRSRGIDDSCNIETGNVGIDFTGAARSLPGSIWNAVVFPAIPATDDATPLELGVRFTTSVSGFATGIRFYKGATNTGTHVGRLWTAGGTLLASVTFTGETATGWQTALFATPVTLDPGVLYVASYSAPDGHYAADPNYFTADYDLAPLTAPAAGNGVYSTTVGAFPTSTFGATNYWADVMFDTDDGRAPTVAGTNPAANVSQVATTGTIAATFSEAMNPASLIVGVAGPGGPIAGSVSYSQATRTVSFTPSAPLSALTSYTATIAAGSDVGGTAMATPHSWAFTTAGPVGSVPTALWTSADSPSLPSADDADAIEVGLRFRSTSDGFATAIRFFKGPANTGTHVGHLWTSLGTPLATVTFQDEGLSGWQEASLPAPVPLTAGTVYVVSYYAPNGRYAADAGYFAATDRVRGPLHGLASPGVGGNGVFHYGAGGGFPTTAVGASNYWVDVVFATAPDATPPVVVSTTPAVGIQGVAAVAGISATFDDSVIPGSTTFALHDSTGASVAGTLSHDPTNHTATFQPAAPLALGRQHTATVSATNVNGLAMTTPHEWSFTTTTPVGTTPATIWDTSAVPAVASNGDSNPIELGVKFRCEVDGVVTAIRFYKGTANTGAHVGRLWSAAGALLGTVPFLSESQSGWQQANFATPIPIAAGQTYVASYLAPNGHFAVDLGGLTTAVVRAPLQSLADGVDGPNGVSAGGGLFPTSGFGSSNYWVDVVVDEAVRPTVTDRVPAPSATEVAPSTTVRATFSEAVQPGSIVLQLRDGSGALVAGGVGYDAPTRTATLVPTAPLALGATYTASVVAAADLVGNALLGPVSWSFTTVSPEPPSIQPLVADATEPAVRLSQHPNG